MALGSADSGFPIVGEWRPMRTFRPVLLVVCVLLLAGMALVAGYAGGRAGRHYEYNYLCCGMAKRHNILTSLKESLSLVRFPSQIGQDRWVAEVVFPGVTNGYFLDVGSADGFVNSNTWALERRGWSGICVDPFPANMGARTCRIFKDAVDSVSGRKVSFAAAGETGGIANHLASGKDAAEGAPRVTLDDGHTRGHPASCFGAAIHPFSVAGYRRSRTGSAARLSVRGVQSRRHGD